MATMKDNSTAPKLKLALGRGKTHTLTYGAVTLKVARPDRAVVEKNVSEGRTALTRVGAKLTRPGIKLARFKGVPLYHADPERPGGIIRSLDGKIERGTFQGREFQVTE